MKASGPALLVCPAKRLLRIDSVYFFIAKDDKDNEGLCAATIGPGGTIMPLIAADPERLKSLTPVAEAIAMRSGMAITLVEFRDRVELRKITGPMS
jgi:hypothetical protein